jgi:hypothetical protein
MLAQISPAIPVARAAVERTPRSRPILRVAEVGLALELAEREAALAHRGGVAEVAVEAGRCAGVFPG